MERKSRKIYYTMGEVSEMFDVNPSLIRFWEQKFDILKPDKNKKGNRLFTPRDVENLKLIYHLVKENGMTLAGAAKRLRENREGVERNLEIIEKLQRMRAMLMDVREVLKTGDEREVFVDTEPADEADMWALPAEPPHPETENRTVAPRSSEIPDEKQVPAPRVEEPAADTQAAQTEPQPAKSAPIPTTETEDIRPTISDEGLEAGPPVPPFIQREIPVPPQPVPSPPAIPPVVQPEPPQPEPKEVPRPSIVEQTLF